MVNSNKRKRSSKQAPSSKHQKAEQLSKKKQPLRSSKRINDTTSTTITPPQTQASATPSSNIQLAKRKPYTTLDQRIRMVGSLSVLAFIRDTVCYVWCRACRMAISLEGNRGFYALNYMKHFKTLSHSQEEDEWKGREGDKIPRHQERLMVFQPGPTFVEAEAGAVHEYSWAYPECKSDYQQDVETSKSPSSSKPMATDKTTKTSAPTHTNYFCGNSPSQFPLIHDFDDVAAIHVLGNIFKKHHPRSKPRIFPVYRVGESREIMAVEVLASSLGKARSRDFVSSRTHHTQMEDAVYGDDSTEYDSDETTYRGIPDLQ